MHDLSSYIQNHMDVVYFIYGLAFFTLGLVIFVQPKEESRYELSRFIWLLAFFGLTHGALEWLDIWKIAHGDSSTLSLLKVVFLFVSYVFLFEFGRRLTRSLCDKIPSVPNLVGRMLMTPIYSVVALGFLFELLVVPDWLLAITIASRYFLGFVGSFLAGVGFLLSINKKLPQQAEKPTHSWVMKYFVLAATSFLIYGVLGGLMVPPTIVTPSNIINDQWFLATFQIPVQLFRAACAVLAAIAVGNILRVFHLEVREKLFSSLKLAQESEVRIRTILNTSLDAFISMGGSGLITSWNAEAERLFGYSRNDVIGKNLAELIIPPAYRDAHARGLKHFMEVGKGPFIGGRVEVTAMRSDRREFPAELSITAISQGSDTFFSAFMRDITERKQAESKISFLAYHDKLTELPNRELFYDRLSHAISQAKRKHDRLALLFLDLDGFKSVNDCYGHEAGDIVLKAVALRLQTCVRGVDTVARLGGDEFTIILSEVDKPTDVTNVAEKIIQKLSAPVLLYGEHKCSVGISIGIAIYPEDGYELDKLMSAADSAMYESKAGGKNTYTFFKEQTSERAAPQPWIVLDAAHLLGVSEIDLQHQELANLINRLNDAVKHYVSAEVVIQQFDDMISYARSHFEAEECLMNKYGYIESEVHKQSHQRLMGEANYLRRQFIQGGELLVLQYLKDWLLPHIFDMDKPFASYLIQHGVNKLERV